MKIDVFVVLEVDRKPYFTQTLRLILNAHNMWVTFSLIASMKAKVTKEHATYCTYSNS